MLISPKGGSSQGSWRSFFSRFSSSVAHLMGNPLTFSAAVLIIVLWAAMGRHFHFSDTWQLIINTGTTIVTFLMVFVIQNTQNRDSAALQIKLDEIIRSLSGAHNALIDLENLSDRELEELRKRYRALAREASRRQQRGEQDTDSPEIPE